MGRLSQLNEMKTKPEIEAADRVCDLAIDQIRELRKQVHTVFEALAQPEQAASNNPSDDLVTVEAAVRASAQSISRISKIGEKLDGIIKEAPTQDAIKAEKALIRHASTSTVSAYPAQQLQQRCTNTSRILEASVGKLFPSASIDYQAAPASSSPDPSKENELISQVLEECDPCISATVCEQAHLSGCVAIRVVCDGVFKAFVFCRSGSSNASRREHIQVVRIVIYGDNEPEVDKCPWKMSSHSIFQRLTELASHVIEKNKPPACFSPLGSVLEWLASHKNLFSKSDNQPSKLMKLLY